MITSPTKRSRIALAASLLAGVALVAGIGMPASGQDTPESLLPPGFDDPAPTAAPTPAPTRGGEVVQPIPAPDLLPDDSIPANVSEAALGNEQDVAEVDLTKYELPEFARHSLARVGVLAAGNTPFPANAFGATDGRYLQTLMRRLDAPVASRWASIVLRRALMSPTDTPANIGGADFAAERAWLLVRMGEAIAARAVVSDVDIDNYTTRLFQVAEQVSLATADPAGLCPIAEPASVAIGQRGWALAKAMCAGLAGKPNEAGQLLSQARRGTGAGNIDNLLAEKIVGAGAQGRRAVTIEWNGVSQLTSWRWGLATATGLEVPASLYQTAGPQVRYWQALSPYIDPAARAPAAELAATAGVFSNAGLVDLYSEIDQAGEGGNGPMAIARDLRTAYTDSEAGDRLTAIRTLWSGAQSPRMQYARSILTARAASWIPANAEVEEPEKLIASMLSAGLEASALEWRSVVPRGSMGWGLLALADPATTPVAFGDFDTFREATTPRKAQMMLAGLAGLGRLETADAQRGAVAVDVQIGGFNDWTRAIDAAGIRGDGATVALLAAVGMQTSGWERVTPEALFHIVAAMRAAGMTNYARMIAVEAVTRA
ncbi:hypothetical protein [Sphingomonas sp. M1-B02]|uniref:hypothetical protein n=1 Tax=Sphingomonas sp. M1-B02 TaxID=3114300 RepID=UPI00224048F0|nr:hypothetical protein [Sphingomonas sp. S6-11]UZK66369.1 hypothetical protein OKW87_00565 [Sphingomonas sp. S6-11]